MKRSAFTIIELIMVIVVLGILASMSIPRLQRDIVQEAADSILSDIRYTQHLALTDNKHKFNKAQWQRAFWKFSVESCADSSGLFLAIGTDRDLSSEPSKEESALDPVNGKPMFWKNTDDCTDGGDNNASNRIFLTHSYNIISMAGSGGCAGVKHIGFDNTGRPHVSFSNSNQPNYDSVISEICTFTFTMEDDSTFAIDILPETGYAYIVGQKAS